MKPEKLAASLWIHLAKCYELVLQKVRHIEKDFTLPQFDAMVQLLRHPEGMTPGELSREMLVTAGNVTGIVNRLQSRGYIERTVDPADRRIARLRLSPAGARVVRARMDRHERALAKVFRGVPGQSKIRFALRDLLQSLERRKNGCP